MSISGWVIGVTAAITVGTLADIVMADGSTKKFVKGVSALIVFAALIAPIPKLLGGDISFDIVEEMADEDYLQDLDRNYAESRADLFAESLKRDGFGEAVVSLHTGAGDESGKAVAAVITLSPETFDEEVSLEEAEISVRKKAAVYFSIPENMVIIVGA